MDADWVKDTQPGRFVRRAVNVTEICWVLLFILELFFEDQGHFDEVLADEPGLELVGAEDVADDEIVGALIAGFRRPLGDVEAALDDEFVGLEEAGDLDGNLFPAAGRTVDAGDLGYIAAHGDGDAAEELDALGDGVDHLNLLVEVLIEEEVKLVEGGAGDLPVVFLVHVAEGDGVGEELVELGDHVGADFGAEGVRHVLDDRAVLLDFLGVGVPVGGYVPGGFFIATAMLHLFLRKV